MNLDTLRAVTRAQHEYKDNEAVQALCAMWRNCFLGYQQPYIVWNQPKEKEDD